MPDIGAEQAIPAEEWTKINASFDSVFTTSNPAEALLTKLKEVFGYSAFRGTQEVVINNLLAGKNTFVIMPTGAGKSMCYQLPALMLDGIAVVISPLIALMKNQVDQLNAIGVNAQVLNSTLTKGEMTRVKKEVLNGEVKLLYVAPESLTKEENVAFLKKAKICYSFQTLNNLYLHIYARALCG